MEKHLIIAGLLRWAPACGRHGQDGVTIAGLLRWTPACGCRGQEGVTIAGLTVNLLTGASPGSPTFHAVGPHLAARLMLLELTLQPDLSCCWTSSCSPTYHDVGPHLAARLVMLWYVTLLPDLSPIYHAVGPHFAVRLIMMLDLILKPDLLCC